jgi:hypothetical protein
MISRRSSSASHSNPEEYSDETYSLIYTTTVISIAVVISMRSLLFFNYCMSIGINLHNRMLQGLVRAPVKFFDENSSGRNR